MIGLLSFALLALLSFFPGAAAAAVSGGARVTIAHAAMNARVAPLWVAQDQGFFSKQGVAGSAVARSRSLRIRYCRWD